MTKPIRTALVIGASGGIGRSTALRLAQDGYAVIINSRSEHKLEHVLADIQTYSPSSFLIAGDNADPGVRQKIFERIAADFGRLDVLVNSIPGASPVSFLQADIGEIEDSIRQKLVPYLDNIKRAYVLMKQGQFGRVINIVGNTGREPSVELFVNGLINAAIVNASKSASLELAKEQITINCVHPGNIRTERYVDVVDKLSFRDRLTPEEVEQRFIDRIPLGRIGTPEEVAALIGFLASEEAGYITGQQFSVDGGQLKSI